MTSTPEILTYRQAAQRIQDLTGADADAIREDLHYPNHASFEAGGLTFQNTGDGFCRVSAVEV